MRMRFWLALPVAAALPMAAMLAALAQDNPAPATATAPIPEAPPAAAAAPPANPPPASASQASPSVDSTAKPAAPTHRYSREQLEQLVAPVALYPDRLLGDILMASTYPAEIVEAARWVRIGAHRRFKGEALAAALKPKGWDPSVMALVPFPDLLKAMNDRLEWLRDLGTAFVAQQADVMAAVQHLRRLAMATGTLKTTPQCHCQVATQGETITITAVEPGPLCIPVYNTRVAYGAWPYPVYPPVVFPVPVGVVFVPGFAIGYYPVEIAWYGPIWGWDSIDWAEGQIIVDPDRYAVLASGDPGFSGNAWSHNAARWGSVAAAAGAAGVGGAAAAAAVHGHGAAAALSGAAGTHAAAAYARPGGAFSAHAGRPAGGGGWRHAGHGFAGYAGRRYHAPHVAMHGRFAGGFSGGGGAHFGMHGFGHGGGHGGGPHFGMGGFAHGGGGHGGGGHGGGGHGGGGNGGGGHGGGGHGH